MPLEPGFRWSTRVRPWLLGLVLMAAWLCLVLSAATVAEEVTDRSLPRIPITEIDAVPGAPLSEHPPTLRRLPLKPAAPPPTLPAEASTRHNLAFAGRTLAFTAKAGAVVFEDQSAPVAEIGYFAYLLDGTEPTRRPVTFAINGGPGAASAWLHIGALGPWRLPITQEAAHPTAPSELLVNGDTWLDFTDLVFIDPAGTGYSRLHNQKDQQVRERFWSVQGDIRAIAVFMKRWLEANGRMQSPKVFLGESYGGFRAPRIAQTLQSMPGMALNGIILVSPALSSFGSDIPGLAGVLSKVSQLPSLAAAIADGRGPVSPQQLAAFEREAAGEYLADLLAGPRDEAAIERLAVRIAAITGLEVDAVRHLGPRSSAHTFLGALDRRTGKMHSNYDATAKRFAAYDGTTLVESIDDLGGLSTQLVRAIGDLAKRQIAWKTEREYHVRGPNVAWKWSGQEAVSALRSTLLRDPTFRVLIAHGYADLVTPYFRTRLLLDQMPTIGPEDRLRLAVYGGGHMFYSRDDVRAMFRKDAVAFFEAIARR